MDADAKRFLELAARHCRPYASDRRPVDLAAALDIPRQRFGELLWELWSAGYWSFSVSIDAGCITDAGVAAAGGAPARGLSRSRKLATVTPLWKRGK